MGRRLPRDRTGASTHRGAALAGGAALLLAALVAGCGLDGSAPALPARSGSDPIAVRLVAAQPAPAFGTDREVGTIEADRVVPLIARVSGEVVAAPYEVGDAIGAEPVILLDDTVYRIGVEEARANLLAARADEEYARAEMGRARGLTGPAISQAGIDAAVRAEAAAEARRLAAEQALALAAERLHDTRVEAPAGARLSALEVDVGRFVAAGEAVGEACVLDPVRIRFQVSPGVALHLAPSDEVPFEIAGLEGPGSRTGGFAGRIVAIAPRADPRTGRFPVEIEVSNDPVSFLPGMIVVASVRRPEPPDGAVLPRSAVTLRDGREWCFRVEASADGPVAAAVGVRMAWLPGDPDRVVVYGLDAGAEVILDVPDALHAGDPVEVEGAGRGPP